MWARSCRANHPIDLGRVGGKVGGIAPRQYDVGTVGNIKEALDGRKPADLKPAGPVYGSVELAELCFREPFRLSLDGDLP